MDYIILQFIQEAKVVFQNPNPRPSKDALISDMFFVQQ